MTTASRLRDKGDNWITGTVEGFKVQAKCYTEPSHYGLNTDARISKLWVKAPTGEVVFNYDRGPDFSAIADADLAMIVTAIGKAIK